MILPSTVHSQPFDPLWTSDDPAPPDGRAWDLLVIGAGTAGIVAATTAAEFGASVLVVEEHRCGGDCLWTGCVPSKALLAAAHAAADARAAARFGVHVGEVRIDFAAVMAHGRATVEAIEPVDSPDSLRRQGASVLRGRATLTGPDAALLRRPDGVDAQVSFRQAVLCTGSSPAIPPIAGLADCDPLTSDTVWGLTELPCRLLVLGGGSVGCELGQAFARLGAQVTLVESHTRLLPREDPDAAELVRAALADDGVDLRLGVRIRRCENRGDTGVAVAADGSTIAFDRVLVATGRSPGTADLGLDTTGIETDRHGFVVVDDQLHTTSPRVWAAGDVTGHPQFTHVAGVHASIAASNAVLGLHRSVEHLVVPRITFTQPELAAVGAGTANVGRGLSAHTVDHSDVDRAVAEDARHGFTRIVLDRRGRLAGASIVSPRAGESVGELALALHAKLRARDIAALMHAYPSWNDGAWKGSVEHVRGRLRRAPVRWLITLLVARRRRRTSR